MSTETAAPDEVKLRIHAEGAGTHTLEIRTSNLEFNEPGTLKAEVRSGHDAELTRQGRITSPETPWVIVVIPDGVMNEHREATGVANPVGK